MELYGFTTNTASISTLNPLAVTLFVRFFTNANNVDIKISGIGTNLPYTFSIALHNSRGTRYLLWMSIM